MRKHEKAFSEIKAYYNDITHNNLDLIKALKEDMSDMKKKETASEKLMHEIVAENKKLADSLQNVISTLLLLRLGLLLCLFHICYHGVVLLADLEWLSRGNEELRRCV